MLRLPTAIVLAVAILSIPTTTQGRSPTAPEKQGCCSSHKGVCGCEKGRVKCCDRTMSPSCRC